MYSEDMRLIFYSERKKPRQIQLYSEDELGTYLPDEEIEELKLDKEYNETIDRLDPAIFSAARWGYRILFYNIRNSGIYVSRLMLLETDRPFKDSDYSLLLYLADFVKYMMNRKNMALNNHPRFIDECIEELLQGDPVNERKLSIGLQELGWNENDFFLCIMVTLGQFDKKVNTFSQIAFRLENAIPESISLLFEDNIVVVCNLSQSNYPKEELLQQLVYILREGMMKAGISREFSSLKLIKDFYAQSKAALLLGNQINPMFWSFRYENYALAHLLSNAKQDHCIESLIPTGLMRLMEYDKEKNRHLTNALKVYLQENMHIANTIKKLYLQRATFLYQLKRIQEISELNLKDPNVRLELLIVFALLDQNK